jgi:predicted PurR-regulated permease PerM
MPHIWALVTFVFCTVPLLGAPIIYVPLALRLMAEGKLPQAIALLAVGFLVVSQVDNILRPFFIGARAKLHEMAVFFSLLGGVLALGPVGIVAGPVVLTLLLGLVDVLRTQRRLAEASG